ncbi:hypothetical protein [Roseibium sp. RKSG952]|uniref:hypothetical protein n=1 Tax=Roseibium sp. RKSG952 TaxID=2529384 RepID=UPI0012BCD036|nr:hypothetical protein [Roseibium sp. RKSG952]MTI00047.1 hypothetical protein [Roseibium sp. RKSG952]
MAQRLFFLLHVPKCAGSTVEHHFELHSGDGFLRVPRWKNPLRNIIGNRYHKTFIQKRLENVKVASGHSLSSGLRAFLPDHVICETVLLRDPLSYLVSFYNYRWSRYVNDQGPKPPQFEKWYSTQRKNPISRFILNRYLDYGVPLIYGLSSQARLDIIEDRLKDFHFVGSYKLTDKMIRGISEELGIPSRSVSQNVTPHRKIMIQDIDPVLRDRIESENAVDRFLFERWKHRGWVKTYRPAAATNLPKFDQPIYLADDSYTAIAKIAG